MDEDDRASRDGSAGFASPNRREALHSYSYAYHRIAGDSTTWMAARNLDRG